MVECAFGIMCNKWRILHRAIDVCPDFCDVIVKICCTLHNFVRQRDGFQFQDTLYECPLDSIQAAGTRGNVTGTAVREYFTKYFTSTLGSVPWQYEMVWSTLYYKHRKCSHFFRTNTVQLTTQYMVLLYINKVYSICWLQGVLYFILLRNGAKVYKNIIKEYSTVSTNKLQCR
jgi:hypothetical protein